MQQDLDQAVSVSPEVDQVSKADADAVGQEDCHLASQQCLRSQIKRDQTALSLQETHTMIQSSLASIGDFFQGHDEYAGRVSGGETVYEPLLERWLFWVTWTFGSS